MELTLEIRLRAYGMPRARAELIDEGVKMSGMRVARLTDRMGNERLRGSAD
jgi:hypothetical protein